MEYYAKVCFTYTNSTQEFLGERNVDIVFEMFFNRSLCFTISISTMLFCIKLSVSKDEIFSF